MRRGETRRGGFVSETDACSSLHRCCKPHTSPSRRQTKFPCPSLISITETCLCLWCHPPRNLYRFYSKLAGSSASQLSSPALAGQRPGRTLIMVGCDPHDPGNTKGALPFQGHATAARASHQEPVSLGGCSGGKRQAGPSYCTCTLDQPSPAGVDG